MICVRLVVEIDAGVTSFIHTLDDLNDAPRVRRRTVLTRRSPALTTDRVRSLRLELVDPPYSFRRIGPFSPLLVNSECGSLVEITEDLISEIDHASQAATGFGRAPSNDRMSIATSRLLGSRSLDHGLWRCDAIRCWGLCCSRCCSGDDNKIGQRHGFFVQFSVSEFWGAQGLRRLPPTD